MAPQVTSKAIVVRCPTCGHQQMLAAWGQTLVCNRCGKTARPPGRGQGG